MKFGDKLRLIREKRNMTQEELATLLGTSKQVISRYETNQRSPKIDIVDFYAKTLGVPLEAFANDAMELPPRQRFIIKIEPRKSDMEKRFTLRMDSSLFDDISYIAKQHRRSTSKEIEEAIFEYVENHMSEFEDLSFEEYELVEIED